MGGYYRGNRPRAASPHPPVRPSAALSERLEGTCPMASNFKEKFDSFMARRNGPDQLARDSLILAVVLLIVGMFVGSGARTVFVVLGLAAMVYSYWRMFSTNSYKRGSENSTYLAKRSSVFDKVKVPFQNAARQGQKTAAQTKDKDHRYFACPKCGQTVRVPKGAGKIRVTCPKCKEKFEKKA